jgi:hypothetical protein
MLRVGGIADGGRLGEVLQRGDDLVVPAARSQDAVVGRQFCELFAKEANFSPFATAVMSASAQMIEADLPPGSRKTPLELGAGDGGDPSADGRRASEGDLVDVDV